MILMGYRKVGWLEVYFYIIKGSIKMKFQKLKAKLKGGGSDGKEQ